MDANCVNLRSLLKGEFSIEGANISNIITLFEEFTRVGHHRAGETLIFFIASFFLEPRLELLFFPDLPE